MTRGQRGSLALHCVALSSTTPRRFIPTHGTPVLLLKLGQRNLRFRSLHNAPLRGALWRSVLGTLTVILNGGSRSEGSRAVLRAFR